METIKPWAEKDGRPREVKIRAREKSEIRMLNHQTKE